MKAPVFGALRTTGPATRPPRRALIRLLAVPVVLAAVLPLATPTGAPALEAASTAPRATSVSRIADALRDHPVYVDPAARSQLSSADARSLNAKIEDAGKPVFVAVLPAGFPTRNLFRDLRTGTGVAGVYGVRLGTAFDARADSSVLSTRAVGRLVGSVQGQGAGPQLTSFADQAARGAQGSAPSSWSDGGGVPSGALIGLGALIAAGGAAAYTLGRRRRTRRRREQREALQKLRVVVDEDITAFGEEVDRLDFHPTEPGADDAMRDDYSHALDAYENAKSAMAAARHPGDVRGVTEALEDGRFALARLAARRTASPLPERRPPCFFDPRHGPSVSDVAWTPPGGAERQVPVCARDEARLREGAAPLVRTVATDRAGERRPYWEAGPAYGPWAGGYFGGGLLPGLLVGTLLGSMMAAPSYGMSYGDGYGDFSGPGFDGGDFSGGDFDPGDFSGGFGGGGDFGGGF